MRWSVLALILALCCSVATPQKKPAAVQNDRLVLEQILQQTYQPSLIGKQMMGFGGETDIRRAGTIVVVQRPGLYGSLLHSEPASSAITGLSAELFRGHKDYEVPVGERYYVTSVAVSSSTVLVGLISARSISTQAGTGRLWTTLSFNFPDQILATADKEAVFQEFDQWFMPEGRNVAAAPVMTATPVAAPVAAPAQAVPASVVQPAQAAPVSGAIAAAPTPATSSRAAAPVAATRQTALAPGMSREQVLQTMGAAQREIQFDNKLWMIYPGVIAVLSDGKLESVRNSAENSTRVNVQSDPAGAEIYVDEELVGSTPSVLLLNPGSHAFRLHAPGHADWTRQVKVLSGSEITLSATLDRN